MAALASVESPTLVELLCPFNGLICLGVVEGRSLSLCLHAKKTATKTMQPYPHRARLMFNKSSFSTLILEGRCDCLTSEIHAAAADATAGPTVELSPRVHSLPIEGCGRNR